MHKVQQEKLSQTGLKLTNFEKYIVHHLKHWGHSIKILERRTSYILQINKLGPIVLLWSNPVTDLHWKNA